MSFQMSAKEAAQVSASRKKVRPSFFSADLLADVEISEDFEAVLILLPGNAKQQIIQQLDATDGGDSGNDKRDAILQAALQQDIENADAIYSEAATTLQESQTAVNAIMGDDRFQSVSEIGLLCADMQRQVDETLMTQQRAWHNGIIAKTVSDVLAEKGAESARLAQKNSWRNIVFDYLR